MAGEEPFYIARRLIRFASRGRRECRPPCAHRDRRRQAAAHSLPFSRPPEGDGSAQSDHLANAPGYNALMPATAVFGRPSRRRGHLSSPYPERPDETDAVAGLRQGLPLCSTISWMPMFRRTTFPGLAWETGVPVLYSTTERAGEEDHHWGTNRAVAEDPGGERRGPEAKPLKGKALRERNLQGNFTCSWRRICPLNRCTGRSHSLPIQRENFGLPWLFYCRLIVPAFSQQVFSIRI